MQPKICLFNIFSPQHVEQPWLLSIEDYERDRAINTILFVLNTFHDNMLVAVGGVSSFFKPLSCIIAGEEGLN